MTRPAGRRGERWLRLRLRAKAAWRILTRRSVAAYTVNPESGRVESGLIVGEWSLQNIGQAQALMTTSYHMASIREQAEELVGER